MSDSSTALQSVFQDVTAAILEAVVAHACKSSQQSPDQTRFHVHHEAKHVEQENAGRIVDAPSERWSAFCSLVLAAYQMLRAVNGAEAVAILQEATTRPFARHIDAYLEDRMGISQNAPEEAFDRIAENFHARGEERFGVTFAYEQEVQDQNHSHILVTRCFFADFFAANGAPEVTPVLCAMDMVWAEELEHPHYRVYFERPTTLAAGSDACRFHFSRRT